jgi:hypothetical protein
MHNKVKAFRNILCFMVFLVTTVFIITSCGKECPRAGLGSCWATVNKEGRSIEGCSDPDCSVHDATETGYSCDCSE